MVMTDPIADFLTRLRNGAAADKDVVLVRKSKLVRVMAEILTREGYLESVDEGDDDRTLRVTLRRDRRGRPVLRGLKRVSKPGCRIYVKAKEIKPVYSGMGVALVSTSKGVLTDREARQHSVGGELLCTVW